MKQDRVMSYIPITIVAVCIGISQAAVAYEQPTHEELTEAAATRSELPRGVLRDLGLVDLKSQLNGKSVLEWMRYGADFEDSKIPYNIEPKFRFLNHFYNPLNGQGFSDPKLPGPVSTGLPSPSWGLEDESDIDGQDYSLKDGYQWLLNGLTLPNKSDREEYLAKTFRTLGHVVHLIQDAGQPQHTRNDDHWYKSLYETVSNEEMKNKTLPYDGYPIVQFSKPRDFFHTLPPGASNVLQGRGLAEYSNRGFVTTRTNFTGSLGDGSSEFPISTFINNPNFPTPNGNGATISTLNIHDPSLLGNSKPNLMGDISFVGTNVPDTYDPSKTAFNPRTSSYSVFDADLEKYNLGGAKFTLNRFNIKEAHKFLIPRAVSYSAGLINWFFRSKIDMVKDSANANQYLIKNIGTEPLQGTFTLYYDDVNDVRKSVDGAQWTTATLTPNNQLDPAATITAPAFTPPTDAKTANTYTLVFVGKIGADITNPAAMDSVAAKIITNVATDVIVNGYFHTCELLGNGTVRCWGDNSWGQLGDGTYNQSTDPVMVLGITSAVALSAGVVHTCALLADGTIRCWGRDYFGELGDGLSILDGVSSSASPVTVLGISSALAIAAGGSHTCAEQVGGATKCWGDNLHGQLGDGHSQSDNWGGTDIYWSAYPVSVLGISSAIAVFAGEGHSCVVLIGGAVNCWGANDQGQLGDGNSGPNAYGTGVYWSSTPATVLGINSATSFSVSGFLSKPICVRLTDGAEQCWGWGL